MGLKYELVAKCSVRKPYIKMTRRKSGKILLLSVDDKSSSGRLAFTPRACKPANVHASRYASFAERSHSRAAGRDGM